MSRNVRLQLVKSNLYKLLFDNSNQDAHQHKIYQSYAHNVRQANKGSHVRKGGLQASGIVIITVVAKILRNSHKIIRCTGTLHKK